VCLGGIIPLPWFSKELKMTYQRTIGFMTYVLILLVRESIFIGWGFSVSYIQELVFLRVGCVTTRSRGTHQRDQEVCISQVEDRPPIAIKPKRKNVSNGEDQRIELGNNKSHQEFLEDQLLKDADKGLSEPTIERKRWAAGRKKDQVW